jgi:hypothetical protein
MDHLQSILASEAFQNPAHPMHGRLMDAVASWRDSRWDGVPEPLRANFLPQLARSGAYTNPAHSKHAELLERLGELSGSLQWMRAQGALGPPVDPDSASIPELLTSYPASEKKHPLHAAVRARIDSHYQAQAGGTEPVI